MGNLINTFITLEVTQTGQLAIRYVSSAELFDRLDEEERQEIYPFASAASAMMFSGFTVATTYRWIMSERGRQFTMYPWKSGNFLGSGQGDVCLEQTLCNQTGVCQQAVIEPPGKYRK